MEKPARAQRKVSSASAEIGRRIARAARAQAGRVFMPFDFLDLGSPHAVGMALTRLVRDGELQRIARGLYIVPRTHPLLGRVEATPDAIAEAFARREGARIQPSEAMAANLLGLSEQVPGRVAYQTDARARTVQVGQLTIRFEKRPPRRSRAGAPTSQLVFAALRGLGKSHVTRPKIAHLRTTLAPRDRRQLLKDLPFAPAWMHPHIRWIAGPFE